MCHISGVNVRNIFKISCTRGLILVTDVGAVENSFREIALYIEEKLLIIRGIACCALNLLKHLVKQFIIAGLHPYVEKFSVIVWKLQKKVPHTFVFVAVLPLFELHIVVSLHTVLFTEEYDISVFVPVVRRKKQHRPDCKSCKQNCQYSERDDIFLLHISRKARQEGVLS